MKKVGIVFGGKSTEKKISVISAKTVIDNIDKNKYEISRIFIEDDDWYLCDDIDSNYKIVNKKKIDNIISFLKDLDTVFPVLHGKYGEDGTIQGMFEMFDIPYVGCGVIGSAMCMDKVYTKTVLSKANINQCKYVYVKNIKDKFIYVDEEFNEKELDIKEIIKLIESKIKYPVFVKPSRSGSSIGVNRANSSSELETNIIEASKYDNEILIEEGILGKEVECAVLGNNEVITSPLGEILPDEVFYSYDSKYTNNESKLLIPAPLSKETTKKVQEIAAKAYKALSLKGLSRVDFFVTDNNEIYLNEINTLPGFTSISMYPMLMKEKGIEVKDLIDKLINLSLEK